MKQTVQINLCKVGYVCKTSCINVNFQNNIKMTYYDAYYKQHSKILQPGQLQTKYFNIYVVLLCLQ